MLTLRTAISGNTTTLSGVVDLSFTGTVDCHIRDRDTLRIETRRQLGYNDWYERFIAKKEYALEHSGAYPDDGHTASSTADASPYRFAAGITCWCEGVWLKTIQHQPPADNGELWILPSKTIDVSEAENSIVLSLPVHHRQPDKDLYDLDLMYCRLYHCVSSLTGRLQIFDVDLPRDGIPTISTMGPYLGTYVQYQALIARWNAYAWNSAFTLKVEPVGERLTIVVGYTNLNCKETEPVIMSVTATLIATETESGDLESGEYEYGASPLTIFNQGSDSTLDANIVPLTEFYRNDSRVSGAGFEGKSPDELKTCGATITLDGGAEPTMRAEQYHRAIIAIAPATGVDFEYHIQEEDQPKVYHYITVVANWVIGTKVYAKSVSTKIAAVGRIVTTSEDEQE